MALREPQRNLKEPWQHVHVFVAVEVRWRNPRVADFLNLRVPLALHFRQHEPAMRATKKQALGSVRKLTILIEQTRN